MFKALRPAITIIYFLASLNIAYAAGGVYIDSVKVTNGKNVVLTEEFDKGNLEKWGYVCEAWTVCNDKGDQCSLHMNVSSNKYWAKANHRVNFDTAGVVDNVIVFNIAPLEEQAPECIKNACELDVTIYARDTAARIDAEIKIYQTGACNLAIRDSMRTGGSFDPKRDYTSVSLRQAPLKRWATLDLRLDPGTATATALLDGMPILSRPYKPENYRGINLIGVGSTFGDAVPHPEAVKIPAPKGNVTKS